MSGRQVTIKKANLVEMPVPQFDTERLTERPEHVENPFDADPVYLSNMLILVCRNLQEQHFAPGGFASADKMAHLLAGALYGRRENECEDDYRWWCDRARILPFEGNWSSLTKVFNNTHVKGT